MRYFVCQREEAVHPINWRNKYGGLEVSELRRLRQLEDENRRLTAIVADQALDIRALKDVLAKNGYGPR